MQRTLSFLFKHTEIGCNYNPKYSMEYLLELAFLYKYEEERNHVVGDYSQKRLELFNKYNSAIKINRQSRQYENCVGHFNGFPVI